jgi:pimeloyl-ACP methyl ester carboxylesterase
MPWLANHYTYVVWIDQFLSTAKIRFQPISVWMNYFAVFMTILFIIYWIAFQIWCWGERIRLRSGSFYVQTEHGLIDYRWHGSGPVILILHGSPGGSDLAPLWHDLLVSGDTFSVLCPSRFGYLNTSLASSAASIEGQAEAMAGLLQSLDLSKVAVVGIGSGAPVALELARRQPDRVWAMVILAGITKKWIPPAEEPIIAELGTWFNNLFFYVFNGLMTWTYYLMFCLFPKRTLRSTYTDFLLSTFSSSSSSVPSSTSSSSSSTSSTGNSQLGPSDKKAMEETLLSVVSDIHQIDAATRLARASLPPDMRATGLDNDLKNLRELAESPNYAGVTVPTLIVHGRYSSPEHCGEFGHAEVVARQVERSELYVLDGAGELICLGQEGKQLARKVVSFLMTELKVETVSVVRHLQPSNRSKMPSPVVAGGKDKIM